MRHAAVSLLVVSTLVMSGCIDFFTPSQEDVQDAQDADTATDDDLQQANDPTPTAPSGDPGGGSGGEPGSSENESEPEEANVAPPAEQRQDDPDDVDKPGEYALLSKAASNSAVTTSVPTWPVDATWKFRTKTFAGTSCDQTHTVTGSDTYYEVPVYRLDVVTSACGDRNGPTDEGVPRWKDNLMKIEDDGYVEHELVFPLEDGKRWIYHRQGNATVTATLDYVPNYLWNLKTVAAWHVTLEYSSGNLVIEKWYGVEARHYLREEVWAEVEGTPTMFVETDLLEYDH